MDRLLSGTADKSIVMNLKFEILIERELNQNDCIIKIYLV